MSSETEANIYGQAFIAGLFDEMSRTYDRVNHITSLGFSSRWRNQCASHLAHKPDAVIFDLMTGMGECWPSLLPGLTSGRIVAIDFSEGMLYHAHARKTKLDTERVQIHQADVLANEFPEASADHIICAFGLKTLTLGQIAQLGVETARLLKPGGTYSILEISVPRIPLLRGLYLFYLKHVIPLIGQLFLGNPDNYRMLGVYTERFGDCAAAVERFRACGLSAMYHSYFFGCATGLTGKAPESTTGDPAKSPTTRPPASVK
jgi:demethylmenaquinone methyltransferase/2-methoxy-6-polyprenyl-1,4-benzoquinol methylase